MVNLDVDGYTKHLNRKYSEKCKTLQLT